MPIDEETLNSYSRLSFEPLALIMNCGLFQYLCGMYYKRRSEFWVRALLAFGLLGFVFLVPFATPDKRIFIHLNDVSEACTTMTFLVQITIIGRDLNRKVKIRSLRWLTLVSEFLTFVGVCFSIKGTVELFTRNETLESLDVYDDMFEEIALAFIFFFRFYYLTVSKGIKWVLTNRKMDLFLYTLFATHEYPFHWIEAETGFSWESIQAPWHRFTMTLCILQTVKEKFRSANSNASNASPHNKSRATRFETTTPPKSTGGPPVSDLRRAMPVASRLTLAKLRTASQGLSNGMPMRSLPSQVTVAPTPP